MKSLPQHLRAVVFDLDGTLYDNKWLPIRLILADLPNMFVLGAERKARKMLKGKDYVNAAGVYDILFATMAQIKGWKDPERARRWYQDRYMPNQVACLSLYYTPRPMVDELLRALREKGIKTILYTDYGHAREKLEALNIDPELFDGIASAPKMGGLKPCKASIERLMERYDLRAEETLIVGDREDTDGASAKAVGMSFYNVKARPEAWDNLLKELM